MKRIFSFITVVLIIASLLFSFTACSSESSKKTDKINVVATNFALFDFARAVCGNLADVRMLLKPGNESHDYEVTLEDVNTISSSNLFIYIGGESEDWVSDVFESLGSSSEQIEKLSSIDCVTAYLEETPLGAESDEFEESEDNEYDEHIWTSIPNAVLIINAIKDKMAEIDPLNKAEYESNADNYTSELVSLSEQYVNAIKNSKHNVIVVADRFPFRYMAEEYGIEFYAAFSGCSSSTEPSLSSISFLTDIIKAKNLKYIFTIEFSDQKTAKAISAETGTEILTLHSAHNVTKEDFDSKITYLDIMKNNLEALKLALN